MGIMDAIRSKTVDEAGVAWIKSDGTAAATLLANKTGKGAQSLSSEFEIMREDFVRVLYEATSSNENITYVFGKTIQHFKQDDAGVTVHYSDGETSNYDILVGADGQGSRIRKAILPPDSDPLSHMGVYIAHWRVPTVSTDNNVGKFYHAPGGMMIMTRTHSPVESQAAFMLRDDSPELRSITRAPVESQKAFWADKYKNAGWVTPRLIEGMQTSDYFYCQEIVQVRSNTWSKGRVVLLADAACCPSPMTGMGTTSALVGAYVLAGEISTHSEDLEKAFTEYDRVLRPFADEIQKLPAWFVPMFLPRSRAGIWLLHFVVGWLVWLRIPQLASRFSREEKGGWVLPEYSALK